MLCGNRLNTNSLSVTHQETTAAWCSSPHRSRGSSGPQTPACAASATHVVIVRPAGRRAGERSQGRFDQGRRSCRWWRRPSSASRERRDGQQSVIRTAFAGRTEHPPGVAHGLKTSSRSFRPVRASAWAIASSIRCLAPARSASATPRTVSNSSAGPSLKAAARVASRGTTARSSGLSGLIPQAGRCPAADRRGAGSASCRGSLRPPGRSPSRSRSRCRAQGPSRSPPSAGRRMV